MISVNETAMQNVWQHYFLPPGGEGGEGAVGQLAHRGSGNSNTFGI
jgi:hypothetical protein